MRQTIDLSYTFHPLRSYLPYKQSAVLGDGCTLGAAGGDLDDLGVAAGQGELDGRGHAPTPAEDGAHGWGFGRQVHTTPHHQAS